MECKVLGVLLVLIVLSIGFIALSLLPKKMGDLAKFFTQMEASTHPSTNSANWLGVHP